LALFEQIVVGGQGRFVTAGDFFVLLLDRRTGLDAALIQADLLLNLFLLFGFGGDVLVVTVDLSAKLLDRSGLY
jgi:hypothetical protein